MARNMLIDASHPEETRVVIVSGNRLEEFDYETASKQQIKGNIYLAKVTRVEPSLQAAFVDYGGNRHGFLAFNEIHPDYYRIPVADREKLYGDSSNADFPMESEESPSERALADADGVAVSVNSATETYDGDETAADSGSESGASESREADQNVEVMGGDEDDEIDRERRRLRMLRNYRIQEVIKRRQIMLVQVTKEERGNKGAALTTYLSLAGRYCVLMPNTARGGGVSRKISNPADRKRLRVILDDLDIPEGMAVIVRTAGSERSRAEIKRDYEYLMRLWEQIRQATLASVSPTLIHEEGNLIKRSIRDLYSRDIDEVIVDGETAYRTAKDFMRMLMPSHAARVKRYKEDVVPLFQQYQVESQLDEIHSSTVRLKSGGYLVINPTEALVSIDVNSGRATRERHIEETAVKTNLEAAQEVARQLRLRDLAGLIVIDFIDMDEHRNNAAVERKLKEALRGDRARIQIGRISAFGLMEMSRQRLRPSIIEASSQVCPHCNGAGHIRSTDSSVLQVLRGIEEEGLSRRSAEILVSTPTTIALYLLNQKRSAIIAAEQRYDFSVSISTDDSLIAPDFRVERVVERGTAEITQLRGADAAAARARDDEPEEQEDLAAEAAEPSEAKEASEPGEQRADGDDGKARSRRRRSRRRRPRREDGEATASTDAGAEAAEAPVEASESAEAADAGGQSAEAESVSADADGQAPAKSSRRGRRGGRRRRRRDDSPAEAEATAGGASGQEPGLDGESAITADAAVESPEPQPAEPDQTTSEPTEPQSLETAVKPADEVADRAPVATQAHEAEPEAEREPAAQLGNGHAQDETDDTGSSEVETGRTTSAEDGPDDRKTVHADAESQAASEEAAGDDSAASTSRPEQPRRGWWQRLIEG